MDLLVFFHCYLFNSNCEVKYVPFLSLVMLYFKQNDHNTASMGKTRGLKVGLHLFHTTKWKKNNVNLGNQQLLWQESKACTIGKISEDKTNSQVVNHVWVNHIFINDKALKHQACNTRNFQITVWLPVKISQLSKSRDFLPRPLCFCYFHNTLVVVLEMEHKSIVPA